MQFNRSQGAAHDAVYGMTPERWREVSRALDAALELPPEARSAFVDRAYMNDPDLRREVARLLTACEHVDSGHAFLTEPAQEYAAPVLDDLAKRSAAAADATRSVLAGALAGRYAIEGEIARGGMATVYLARDERLHRQVAIKVLSLDLARDLGTERFLREIEIAARLQHPHIVPLYDSGEAAGLLYYVMPFVQGESLRDRLARERHLPLGAAVAIVRDVAQALDYAHAQGVVHRDIKPANILLDGSRAIVADFGVARAIAAAGSEQLTASGIAVGTTLYMSPEQAAGDAVIDGRSDVYSLACVVFEMFAGEPPFTGPMPQAIIAKHMQAPVPDLRVVRSTISGRTQHVVATGLAKVPADRFASAGQMARALEESIYAAERDRRRQHLVMGGAAAVTMSALGVLLLLADGPSDADADRSASRVAAELPRVAVLYFDDLTRDSTLRHIANGLTEELIHELSGVNAFRVISRNGVRPYREREVPFDSMVAALRVNTVVDGSVQRSNRGVRVGVELIDAQSNTNLDRLSFDRPVADFLSLEREVVRDVAAALRRRMGREVRLRGARVGTSSPRARELVLTAQRLRDDAEILAQHPHPQDRLTALETLRRADSFLALAQLADPRWLRPLLDRGWAAYQRARLLRGGARIEAGEDGLRQAQEAVRREPLSAEALELRGTLQWLIALEMDTASTQSQRLNAAEADLRAAVDRDSSLANAWATLSYLLRIKGRFAEAAMAAERALQEDAYLTDARDILEKLFYSAVWLGDKPRAAEWCERGRRSFPGYWRFVECELTLLREDLDARPDERRAWILVKELERMYPSQRANADGNRYTPIYWRMVAAAISARAGRRDFARTEIARARRATEADATLRLDLAYDEAYLRLVLGERERAVELLRGLLEARPALRPLLERDPLFRDLPLEQLVGQLRQ